jgi:hypothetical protein
MNSWMWTYMNRSAHIWTDVSRFQCNASDLHGDSYWPHSNPMGDQSINVISMVVESWQWCWSRSALCVQFRALYFCCTVLTHNLINFEPVSKIQKHFKVPSNTLYPSTHDCGLWNHSMKSIRRWLYRLGTTQYGRGRVVQRYFLPGEELNHCHFQRVR